MRRICDMCGGNGYIKVCRGVGKTSYEDCPRCNNQGEIEDESMEAHQAQRELGE